jgi:hypothetical protein
MPIPRSTASRQIVTAAAARAAYFVATARRDSAEATLRDILGYGLAMTEGTTLIETSMGGVLVARAVPLLLQFYDGTGHADARRLRSTWDSVTRVVDERAAAQEAQVTVRESAAALRAKAAALTRDTAQLRGVRFETLRLLQAAPCTNLRELVFGPTREVRDATAAARTSWARFPSEHSLLDVIERDLERMGTRRWVGRRPPRSAAFRIALSTSRLLARVSGNPRIHGCALIATAGRSGS